MHTTSSENRAIIEIEISVYSVTSRKVIFQIYYQWPAEIHTTLSKNTTIFEIEISLSIYSLTFLALIF